MDTKSVYSSKAEKYAKYRWDYASAALQALIDISGLSSHSVVADIGAGTGILTRHFAGRVKTIYAIEPNAEMRRMVRQTLPGLPGCQIIAASAEATALKSESVDMITVAQAIHWFDPAPARDEIRRILKPGGWLALLRNYGTDEDLNQALAELAKRVNGAEYTGFARTPEQKPLDFYFCHPGYQRLTFPFSFQQGWEAFLGSLLSASFMPDEDHPSYPQFEAETHRVFERFSTRGLLTVRGATELSIGQISDTTQFACEEDEK